MNIIDLGYWEAYRFELPDGTAIAKYKNDKGYDWYSTVAHAPTRPKGVAVCLDPEGAVTIAYDDVSQAEPRMGRVVVLENYHVDLESMIGKRVNLPSGTLENHVTNAQINFERSRREVAGVTVTVPGYGDIPIQGRPDDKSNLQALAFAATLRKQAGIDTTTDFRDRDNNHHELTNDQVIALYTQGVLWMENLYKASWAIKAMDPMPQDYTDDKYWV